ncbi:MAG: hypothetical protein COB15_15445 [Flavobacteriales bacterium]|nr:MAG: hypothetical protein COB15_15445 [Flavobacteriales bacterium]
MITPNVFTPNGDIHNQFLTFKNAEYYENHIEVFNRWGTKVFTADNYQNDWNGDNLNEGTYFFILDVTLPNGETEQYKGSINLLR